MAKNSNNSLVRTTATIKFLKPLLRLLCNRRAIKQVDVAADLEAAAQNAANEALEAAMQLSLQQHHNDLNLRRDLQLRLVC
ncbi:Hypothetical predicted protein [Cloeon dipterum]|uniref:Uncharacterized protein n=1 Tax=Cloeon dipterum TaxID=197152 RepID=A0A8S1C7Y3_9INSE|nr:Hypothetical predicted protein [Cloeon dipterum]